MHPHEVQYLAEDRRQRLLREASVERLASGHERRSRPARLAERRRALGLRLVQAGLRLAYGRHHAGGARVR